MAITFKSIAGSLFNGFKNLFSSGTGYNPLVNTANAFSSSPGIPATGKSGGTTYYNNYTPANTKNYVGVSQGNTQYGPAAPSYTPQYGGGINLSGGAQNTQSMTTPSTRSSSRSDGSVIEQYVPPPTLSGQSAQQYAKSAGLGNLNLEGMTYEEADRAINTMKGTQRGQVNALTSAAFSPDAISNVNKIGERFALSLDKSNNDTWLSAPAKREEMDNLLKSTAKDFADQFDSQEAMINAYDTNPTVQRALDRFAQYGGSDQMLIDAVNAKKAKTPQGNEQTTMEYQANLANQQQQARETDSILNGDKTITDEIARTAKIPEQMKDYYFGDAGIWQQKLNLDLEKVNLLKEKMADEKAEARQQANLLIEKNNAELSVAKNQIELNRVNAKNYLTGMLAKLGALNTTSAAVEGISFLDQKYQQQSTEIEQKTRFANQDIQIKLQKAVSDIDSAGMEKIQAIKEDLSKDKDTMLKDIMKEKMDADKRIYDLTLKASDRLKKNNDTYRNNATKLAEDYTTNFNALVSPDFGGAGKFSPAQVASNLTSKLPAADQRLSVSARIKDPSAISYFKSLPIGFRNEWIQFVASEPANKYFTLADLQMNYEPYKLEQQQIKTTKEEKKTNREI